MKRKISLYFMLFVDFLNRLRISRDFIGPYLRACGDLSWLDIQKIKLDYIWHYKKWEKQNYES